MFRLFLTRASIPARTNCPFILIRRHNHTDYELKYAEKLQKRALAQGIGVADLKQKVKETAREEKRRLHEQAALQDKVVAEDVAGQYSHSMPSAAKKERKDGSPVKVLSSILDLSRIMAVPHTPAQVSALWSAYHLSRSGGTGRGFLCASVPVDMYKQMAAVAAKYPSFVVPLPRPRNNSELQEDGEGNTAFEFYYLQWDFHGMPDVPTAEDDPFITPKPSDNPAISTVLFTPLQEYKSRISFATPYLVLTHYTDLAQTHGIVLLRGEITPNSDSAGSGAERKYILTQPDAQLLSMALQKFYLWDKDGDGRNKAGELLKQFHEDPTQFKWEDLLKHGTLTI
ncbi:hypothetical protein AX15_000925 [Amanita polypyramis BW_CC]|nr:hypothetical protein AX15_000925 [Amanita polypyramis BW_CC]